MKMRFLCDMHRFELDGRPERAINCWQNSYDTGLLLYEQQMWSEALPHFGCAFESSEILISNRVLEPQLGYDLFTSSALLLVDTFKALNYINQSREVCSLAMNRLEHELRKAPNAIHLIKQHLNKLYPAMQSLEQQPFSMINTDTKLATSRTKTAAVITLNTGNG